MSFSKKDIQQIQNKGLTVDKVNAQIEIFKNGLPFVNLKDVATIGNGILRLTEDERQNYINHFNKKRNDISFVKFVAVVILIGFS